MEIGLLGIILIPLGVFLLVKDSKYLLYFTIFFAGFTGTSIVNFGNSFSLQIAYYFGMLFILKRSILILKSKTLTKPNMALLGFIVISMLSLIMPVLLEGKNILILTPDDDLGFVKFKGQNVTQLIYILYCFVVYWLSKDYFYKNPDTFNKAIKVYMWSVISICLLGFYQEFAWIYKLDFDSIFRNNIHGNVQPFGEYVRVYSTTQEPSMLAYFLGPTLGLAISVEKTMFKNKKTLILLIIITGIMSTSTTFLVSILALISKIAFDKIIDIIKKNKAKNYSTFKSLILIIFMVAICIFSISSIDSTLSDKFTTDIYNKASGNNLSGVERQGSFEQQMKVAMDYPILGVGFGASRSKDLLSTWACNIGFIGLSIFICYILNIIIKLKKIGTTTSYGVSNYIFILIVCAFVSVPEPYYLYMWLMFTLAEIAILQKNNKLTEPDLLPIK